MFTSDQATLSAQVAAALERRGLVGYGPIRWQPTPFRGQWGLGTSSMYPAAAIQLKASGPGGNVRAQAQALAEAVAGEISLPPGFEHAEAVNGYLNLYYDTAEYFRRVVTEVTTAGADFGRGLPSGQRVMVEYSQPNTHKAFHVGHLRNVILGAAICNLLEFAGHDVIRANYIGDIGLHVIKWMWCYLKYHAGVEPPVQDRTRWMGDVYAEADRLYAASPANEAEVRALFQRWEQRDPELVALWHKTRGWSLDGFRQNYALLGARFDVMLYESEYEEAGKALVDELIARGIAQDERPNGGPVIIKLDELLGLAKEQYRVFVILRSDGTSLYATKELPLTLRKFREFHLDQSICVVDVRQSLYMQQMFKTIELLGYPEWSAACDHLAYEIVNLPGNVTMKSREGTVVLFEDLVREALARSGRIVAEKNPALADEQRQAVAQAVALGGLKYPLLAVDTNKIVTFDWEAAINFEGQAAPYIQYAHVRAHQILRKAEAGGLAAGTSLRPLTAGLEPAEIALLDLISRFPSEVQRAAHDRRPHYIAIYIFDVAQAFNEFYQACPVLPAPEPVRTNRLGLTAAARQTLANGLGLLGIEAPPVM